MHILLEVVPSNSSQMLRLENFKAEDNQFGDNCLIFISIAAVMHALENINEKPTPSDFLHLKL